MTVLNKLIKSEFINGFYIKINSLDKLVVKAEGSFASLP